MANSVRRRPTRASKHDGNRRHSGLGISTPTSDSRSHSKTSAHSLCSSPATDALALHGRTRSHQTLALTPTLSYSLTQTPAELPHGASTASPKLAKAKADSGDQLQQDTKNSCRTISRSDHFLAQLPNAKADSGDQLQHHTNSCRNYPTERPLPRPTRQSQAPVASPDPAGDRRSAHSAAHCISSATDSLALHSRTHSQHSLAHTQAPPAIRHWTQ
jgi:hypothetical protein